jgi:hypothetical protein
MMQNTYQKDFNYDMDNYLYFSPKVFVYIFLIKHSEYKNEQNDCVIIST